MAVFSIDDRKIFPSSYQKKQSISRQPCRPQRGPLVQSKDQFPSKKSVVLVVCLATFVESVPLFPKRQPVHQLPLRSPMAISRMVLRKPIISLIRSKWLMIVAPNSIGEVSFMLFLILKQLEEVAK
jgi:hypothetical protein